MQKVYLLLRNNRQSGPFSIDELWQQQLRPTDMIWVEGKSTAWAYLTEIELLPTAIVEEAKVISSNDEIEKRAEELRLQALAYQPPRHKPVLGQEWPIAEPGEEEENAEEPIEIVDHRKDKKSVLGELLMTVVILGLFAGGIFGSRTLFQSKRSQVINTGSMESHDQHAAAQPRKPIKAILPAPIADSTAVDTALIPERQPVITLARRKEQKKDSLHVKPVHTISISAPPDAAAPLVSAPSSNDAAESKTKDTQAVSLPPVNATEQPEKKKGLGAALKGLFRKKKKDAPAQATDSTLGN